MWWVQDIFLLSLQLLSINIVLGLCRPIPCPAGSEADPVTTAPGETCHYRRQGSPQEKGTTPTTTEVTTFGYYFEGVDYTIHYRYEELSKDRNDCEALYIWCARRGTAVHHVCGYNFHRGRYYSFYSACEIEIYNCIYRNQGRNLGVYGTHHTNDPLFYNGEGKECWFYYRRAGNAEEMDYLYFGGKKEEVLANWIAQNRAQEELAKQIEERGLEAIMEDEEDTQGEGGHDMDLQDMMQDGNGTADDGMAQNELDETERDQTELEQMVQDGNNMQSEIEHEGMGQGEYIEQNIEQENVELPRSELKQDDQNEMERLHREFEQKMLEKNTIQGGNNHQRIKQGETVRENVWKMRQESMWQDNIGQNHEIQKQSGIEHNGYGKDGMTQRGTGLIQTGHEGMVPPETVLSGIRYPMQQYRGMGQIGMEQTGIWQGGTGRYMWQEFKPAGMRLWQNGMGQKGVGQGRIMGKGYGGIGQVASRQSGMQYGGMYGQNRMQYQQYGKR